jgi:hypothetical protein
MIYQTERSYPSGESNNEKHSLNEFGIVPRVNVKIDVIEQAIETDVPDKVMDDVLTGPLAMPMMSWIAWTVPDSENLCYRNSFSEGLYFSPIDSKSIPMTVKGDF